jgi:hypothetical protein
MLEILVFIFRQGKKAQKTFNEGWTLIQLLEYLNQAQKESRLEIERDYKTGEVSGLCVFECRSNSRELFVRCLLCDSKQSLRGFLIKFEQRYPGYTLCGLRRKTEKVTFSNTKRLVIRLWKTQDQMPQLNQQPK